MRTRTAAAALLCASLCAFGTAAGPAAQAAETVVTDAGGRRVKVADASRILSIGGDITEIIYALGAEQRLVAIDSTSLFPVEALKQKKSVGYMRALSTEGVISVDATVVIASERAGPPEVVKTLKSTSVPYVEIPDDYSAGGIVRKVKLIAQVVGAQADGERVARQVETDFAALATLSQRVKKPLRALFVLAVQNGRALVGGQQTSADAILKLAGAENVVQAVTGFKPLPGEAIVELAPDVIVAMPRTGSDAHDVAGQIFQLNGIASTPAGLNKRLIVMDGLFLLGFGPRAPAAARELMGTLYPDLAGASK